mmetsp:Transcript_20293/g.50210  ORF Transcript_20293/g.50210 Transcript_20293/m.50210 type:complete len:139 (-) Transcript_20293:235-651(-)
MAPGATTAPAPTMVKLTEAALSLRTDRRWRRRTRGRIADGGRDHDGVGGDDVSMTVPAPTVVKLTEAALPTMADRRGGGDHEDGCSDGRRDRGGVGGDDAMRRVFTEPAGIVEWSVASTRTAKSSGCGQKRNAADNGG